jgi:hypothetical protein
MHRTLPLLALLAACAPETDVESTPFDVGEFLRVVVSQAVGNVTVRGGDEPKVEGALEWAGEVRPELRTRLAGDTLLVFASCPEGTRRCRLDLDVVVPDTTDVDVNSALGDVTVQSLAGVVDLDVTEGLVTVADVTGNTRVSLAEGDLVLDHVIGRLDLIVGEGDVTGGALEAPTFALSTTKGSADVGFSLQPDILTMATEKGDLRVQAPRGDYEITASAPRGEVSVVGVTNTIDAGSLVDLYTRRGDIAVSGN